MLWVKYLVGLGLPLEHGGQAAQGQGQVVRHLVLLLREL